ncbi:MAG: SDR family oxidoreductase [Polyangiales bacterium]
MPTLLTGATGYLGGYALKELLARSDAPVFALVRARSITEATDRLWRTLALHVDAAAFRHALARIEIVLGDITEPGLGLGRADRERLDAEVHRVLHVAASLNRKSARDCMRVNVHGTANVLDFARARAEAGALERFTHVSTTAVAGNRPHTVVPEAQMVDWSVRDFDPYGQTKKMGEVLVERVLAGASTAIVRPSIVLGDARMARTTQFDMIRAFGLLAKLPVIPADPASRLDIVNADFVGAAMAAVHLAPTLSHGSYNLSAGAASETLGAITRALATAAHRPMPVFVPVAASHVGRAAAWVGNLRTAHPVRRLGALVHVFWPYVTEDTVYDSTRIRSEFGLEPEPFTARAGALYAFAERHGYAFPHTELGRTKAPEHGGTEVLA